MRHRNGNKKLGRPNDQRIALIRSISRALFLYEKINTTSVRAKAVKRMVEQIVSLAKDGSLASRRRALMILPDKDVVSKVFSMVEKGSWKGVGGVSRIVPLGFRLGDAARIVRLELVN